MEGRGLNEPAKNDTTNLPAEAQRRRGARRDGGRKKIPQLFLSLLITHYSLLLFSSCEREIVSSDPDLITNGFEVRGRVVDRLGNPIPGVDVLVDYRLRFVDSGPEPTRVYNVTSPSEFITVNVVRLDGRPYRTVLQQTAEQGQFRHDWNGTGSGGSPAPPGAYFVQYLVGGTIRHEYPFVMMGSRASRTDSSGIYRVLNEFLPVDFYPVPEYSSDGRTYFGNSQVTNQVFLTFQSPFSTMVRSVDLVRDQIVVFDVRMN